MKILKLFTSYQRWTRGYFARTRYVSLRSLKIDPGLLSKTSCDYMSDSAQCWCLGGALRKCYGDSFNAANHRARARLLRAIRKFYPGMSSIVDFNDDPKTTFNDILRVVRAARV